MSASAPRADVIICTHDPSRWALLNAAVDSANAQRGLSRLIVVVDGDELLWERARRAFSTATVLRTEGSRGLSAARNLGLRHSEAEIVAFLDDDAVAARDWLPELVRPFADARCGASGGHARPVWPNSRPHWFSPLYDWTVGCTHPGHPQDPAEVRNVIGCNMAFRSSALDEVGGFDAQLGRVGHNAAGGEETEICMRLASAGWTVWYQPTSFVDHHVSADRCLRRYVLRRSHREGMSKAVMGTLVEGDGIGEERGYVLERVVPEALRDVGVGILGRWARLDRGLVSLAALVAAASGLVRGRLGRLGHGRSSKATSEAIALADPRPAAATSSPAPKRAGSTVIIATHGRPDGLARTLDSVLRCDPAPADIVVVENGTRDLRVEEIVAAHPGVTLVRERAAGLAHAHNVALSVVDTDLVAITDDDVVVDPAWVGLLEAQFADPDVGCVTGLVVGAAFDSEAERLSELAIGHGKGDHPREFRPDAPTPMFPFTAGELGTGANMAFRVAALEQIGGFDVTLGAGTPARGADDLAAFADVVRAGWVLRYEPRAVIRHHHHSTMDALRRQIFGYGVGYGAYVARLLRHDPRLVGPMLRHLCSGFRRAGTMGAEPTADVPRHLGVLNLLGMALGPVALARSRREMARRLAA